MRCNKYFIFIIKEAYFLNHCKIILFKLSNLCRLLILEFGNPFLGHVDGEEDFLEAAIRETEEEAGLKKLQYKIDCNLTKNLEVSLWNDLNCSISLSK